MRRKSGVARARRSFACADRSGRELRPLRGEVTEQKVAVRRREVEAARRLVDELETIRPRVGVELVVDPPDRFLDRGFACVHGAIIAGSGLADCHTSQLDLDGAVLLAKMAG
jgi:hypothetical protein